jgi:hypothetical protein
MRPSVALIALAAASFNVNANTLGSVNEDIAAAYADTVVDVEIRSEHAIRTGAIECGSRYRAKITSRMKGRAGFFGRVSFNSWGGLRVGKRYRLFMKDDPEGTLMRDLLEERSFSREQSEGLVRACLSSYGNLKRAIAVVRLDRTK